MIEIDDQITKPLNLANSAVLRAVEEEEQQVKCGDFFPRPRQSRNRQRSDADDANPAQPPHHALHQQLLDQIKTQYHSHQNDVIIDRDTVLRINRFATRRHLLKRDHSWPPVEPEHAAAHSVTPSQTHSIDALREKFNSPTRIVSPTVQQAREQRLQLEGSSLQQQPRVRTPTKEQANPLITPQTPKAKGFSAPETKAADADIGLVAPMLEYYEQLTHTRPITPTQKSSTPYRPRLKRQSYSLDRGRARKRAVALNGGATELPPPKPRNGTPKVQRRSIKLATELKICYDTDDEEEPKVSASGDIDLETLPLPATPRQSAATAAAAATKLTSKTEVSLPRKAATVIDSLALKQQQQLALALATAATCNTATTADCGRIIPVTVSAETTSRSSQPGQLQAQQIYDEACNYLRQDHQQQQQQLLPASSMPPTNTDDNTPPATYVSATSGIKLQRQDSSAKTKTQTCNSSCIPTPPPLPPPPTAAAAATPLLRLKSREDAKDKQLRRQGGIYAETTPTLAKQHEAHVEIAQLEAKYAHIQQSITEHLRQIDEYMENAKTALQRTVQATPRPPTPPPPTPPKPVSSSQTEPWDLFASRQSPILAVESPLQAILRQIYCRAAGIQLQPKEQDVLEASIAPAMPAENVPIVERALEDLHKIAVALDSDEHALLLHVEHKTTPIAAKAQHVVIEEEQDVEQETAATPVNEEDNDFSLDYKHVSDVIANYEQLATGKESLREIENQQEQQLSMDKEGSTQRQKVELSKDKEDTTKQQQQELSTGKEFAKKRWQTQLSKIATKLQEQQSATAQESSTKQEDQQDSKPTKEQAKAEAEVEKDASTAAALETRGSQGCLHAQATTDDVQGSWCAVCGECRNSPHGWGKLNKADQWRFDNLHNEPLANYKSTYEIRSPYISRQISWEDAQEQSKQQQQSKEPLQRQRSVVEILTTPAADAAAPADIPTTLESKDRQLSRSPSPQPLRKYPAPLIETAQRCSSPFGLNAVQLKASPRNTPTPTPTPIEAKYTHVPQLEGHNIGLLVRTATEPLQLCMYASSSMLAATPPATPRCNSQPPPFDFLLQHGLEAQPESSASSAHFKSLASCEELPQASREFNINRSFDNVSPRPYIGIEGYKRVAWPPASEERIVREFTPQPQTQSPAPGSGGYYPLQPASASGSAAPTAQL